MTFRRHFLACPECTRTLSLTEAEGTRVRAAILACTCGTLVDVVAVDGGGLLGTKRHTGDGSLEREVAR